jgi:hypothetical protein
MAARGAEMSLSRKIREAPQAELFEVGEAWQDLWWGMPSYEMGDARPLFQITVNLFTVEDLIEFGNRLGLRVKTTTDTLTFPPEEIDKPSDWRYTDET